MRQHRLFALLSVAFSFIMAAASDFPYQSLDYSINWHCAFIDEHAATASVQISCYDGTFNAILDGRSIPVADIIYCVNDTLESNFVPSGVSSRPASENVVYQSGYYRKPHTGDRTDISSPSSYRNIDGGGSLSADASTMECVTLTSDLLCMFYYAKTVDFDNMQQGIAIDVPVRMPYGGVKTMQLLYLGPENYQGRPAFKMIANFTYNGALSSYPVTIYIDREWKVPLSFSASIAIGHVEMIYQY